jgi:Toprim domain
MGNYLKMVDKQRILALLSLGWSYRRVERATGVRRETVARYDPRRGPGPAANPANLSTGSPAAAFRRVVVALDADAAGDRASDALLRELAPFARSVERVRPPSGKDWNDALLADYPGLCDYLEERMGR